MQPTKEGGFNFIITANKDSEKKQLKKLWKEHLLREKPRETDLLSRDILSLPEFLELIQNLLFEELSYLKLIESELS